MDGSGPLVLVAWLGLSLALLAVELVGLLQQRLRSPDAAFRPGRSVPVERALRLAGGALLILLAAGVMLAVVGLSGRLD